MTTPTPPPPPPDPTPESKPSRTEDPIIPPGCVILSDADLSTRQRLSYIKGPEREALNTAAYWQQKARSLESRLSQVEAENAELRKRLKVWLHIAARAEREGE